MPKIAIDVTFLTDQYFTRGIGRYGREIVTRAIRQPDVELYLIGQGDFALNLAHLGMSSEEIEATLARRGLYFKSLGGPRNSTPIVNIWRYYGVLRPTLSQIAPDVYYAVHFERGLPSDLVPTVATVHDAIPLAIGQFSRKGMLINKLKGNYYRFMWKKILATKRVITISNTAKHDLVKHGGIPSEHITVIYNGISDVFRSHNIPTNSDDEKLMMRKYKLSTEAYLIYDTGLEANKNADQLLEIFAKLARKLPNLKLVITGGDFDANGNPLNERADKFTQRARELGVLGKLVPTGRVSDEQLAILFAQSKAYINLANYEGFGFGPLQAMAAGTPAIISNNDAFMEVSGEGALVLDTKNDIAEAVVKIINFLSNDSQQKQLKRKGFEVAERYNWEKTFAQVWEIIMSVATNTQNGG